MDLPKTFMDFLVWIGSPVVIGVVISILLPRWEWFMARTKTVKFWLTGLVCVGLPIISQVLIVYLPGQVVVFVETWWPVMLGGMGIWMASQIWFEVFGQKKG